MRPEARLFAFLTLSLPICVVGLVAIFSTEFARQRLDFALHRFLCEPRPEAIHEPQIFHHVAQPCSAWQHDAYGAWQDGTTTERPGEFSVTVEINSLGFRNREYPLAKGPQTRRIILLGDSFTFGFGVELDEGFFKRLETRLNETSPYFGPDENAFFFPENGHWTVEGNAYVASLLEKRLCEEYGDLLGCPDPEGS